MVIDTGNTPEADDVLKLSGLLFRNQGQLIWNADLIGLDGDLKEDYFQLKRDALSGISNIDTTNSIILDLPIFGANVLDDFQDNSIDATIWTTTGSVTETSERLNFADASDAVADGASTQDFNQAGTIFVDWEAVTSQAIARRTILVDESANEVVLRNEPNSFSRRTLRLEVDPGTNNVEVFTDDLNGDGSSTSVDVTSLTDGDAWHIKFEIVSSGAPDPDLRVFHVRWLANSIVNIDFVSTATTTTPTITDAIFVVNETIGTGASATYFLSADNGSNDESVTPNEIHRFSNTGTQLKVKVTMTNPTTDKVYQLNHYAVWYNLGAV